MMLHFLTPLLCLVIMTAHSHAADSFLKAYPSGKKLLQIKGCEVRDYPSLKRTFTIQDPYICSYPSGKKILQSTGIIPQISIVLLATGHL